MYSAKRLFVTLVTVRGSRHPMVAATMRQSSASTRGERAMLTESKESISTTLTTASAARPRLQATSDEALMERTAKGDRLARASLEENIHDMNSGRPNPREVFVSYRRLDDEPPPDCSSGDGGGFV